LAILLLLIAGASQSLKATSLLTNGDFSSPVLAPGAFITDTAINSYGWNNNAAGVSDNYIFNRSFPTGDATVGLLGGGSQGAGRGLQQIVGAVSSTTQTTRYTFSVDIWSSYQNGANGVYGGNAITFGFGGGGLGTDGSNFIYVESANKVGNTGMGNILIAKANDNFNLISNLTNTSVTSGSPQSNFSNTFVNNQWNTLNLSWDLAANNILNGSSEITVYLARPTGSFEGSSNWTAYDNATLTAMVIPEPSCLALAALGFGAVLLRMRSGSRRS